MGVSNYELQLEHYAPCVQIINMIDRQVPTELIYMTIECDFGVNYLCKSQDSNMPQMVTILDDLLLTLEAYHEFDDIDDKFYSLAELVLLMVRSGAKCARDLTHIDLIHLDNHLDLYDQYDEIDSFNHIFRCLSIDSQRFKYLHILKHNHPQYLEQALEDLIDIILQNRNFCDEFNPQMIAQYYDQIFGINSPCINGSTLMQILTQKNLNLMRQVTELHELYKRIIALIAAVRIVAKDKP